MAGAQKTVEYRRDADGTGLSMDIYQPAGDTDKPRAVVVFVFGGGFFTGSRSDTVYRPYFDFLTGNGYVCVAIDYRLGLKGSKKAPSLFNRKPLINAIAMAVEDTYSATNYLLRHAKEFNIDTGKIILSGSSAGAITVLQSDYEKRNGFKSAAVLPASFQYAGVIACAGAIYSKRGMPSYAIAPAPTIFFHGSKDNIVPYKKISFLGTGLFGSMSITRERKKDGYPYVFYSFEGVDHSAALFPLKDYQQAIQQFIQGYVLSTKPLFVDVNIKDLNRKNTVKGTLEEAMRRQ
ncbi:MAG: carboxylesterase family protein [Bacteroidetes bacterium]|nr:carboxylesterase family protein [Bacteroidota bacterium]